MKKLGRRPNTKGQACLDPRENMSGRVRGPKHCAAVDHLCIRYEM